MKIRTEYQGMTLTDKYLTIHFRLELGGTLVRHATLKLKVVEIPDLVFSRALDQQARRRLIESWSESQEMLPWD